MDRTDWPFEIALLGEFSMSVFTLRARLGAAAFALLLGLWPAGAALADTPPAGPNFLTMTELSSTQLRVSFSLMGFSEDAILTGANDRWGVGPFFTNHPSGSTPDNSLVVNRLAWLEPGSSMDDFVHAKFNAFLISSCNCSITAPSIEVASDLNFNDINNPDSPWFNYYCIFGHGFTACPFLQDGQAFSIPISHRDDLGSSVADGPMTVRFTDRGDVLAAGVPEPSAWTLLIAGFGLIGVALRAHRRRQGANACLRMPLGAAAVFLALCALPAGAARAQDVLTMTERSSTDLDVALSIGDGFYSLTETETGPGDAWIVGGEFGPLPLITPHTSDNQTQVYVIGWIEPGGSMANLAADTFNILAFSPSGNHGTTDLVIYSDQSYGFFQNLAFHSCFDGVFVACPILLDGQSTGVPYELRRPIVDNLFGTLTVTFHDRGDVLSSGVPEPAAWTMMLLGFGGLGAMLRRRRVVVA